MADLTLAKAKEELQLSKPSFEEMNLNKLSFSREMEFAIQAFEKNPYLLKTVGIGNVLKNVVLSGLSLNPVLKYAYLVPRKIGSAITCCVDPSYVGLCKILTDTGSVAAISATIVYERETGTYVDKEGITQQKFQIQQGAGGWVKHTPYIGFDDPGKAICCYSIGILANGLQHVELLRPFEWTKIKARSESVKTYETKTARGDWASTPTWMTDENEMIRKTCLKKHYKYLPKSERAIMAATAIDLDNQINGIDFENETHQQPVVEPVDAFANSVEMAGDAELNAILDLLNNTILGDTVFGGQSIKENMKNAIPKQYRENKLTKEKAIKVIEMLSKEIEELENELYTKD